MDCPICFEPLDTGLRCAVHGFNPIPRHPASRDMDILNAVFQLSGTVAQHNSELSMRLTDMERRLSEKRR
jgi:hypothetical protein